MHFLTFKSSFPFIICISSLILSKFSPFYLKPCQSSMMHVSSLCSKKTVTFTMIRKLHIFMNRHYGFWKIIGETCVIKILLHFYYAGRYFQASRSFPAIAVACSEFIFLIYYFSNFQTNHKSDLSFKIRFRKE